MRRSASCSSGSGSGSSSQMHVGAQNMNLTDKELSFLTRHGVFHADFNVKDMSLPTLLAAKAKAAAWGVSLEMIHIDPYIMDGAGTSFISAAQEPEREQSLVQMCEMIENAGLAGIRGLNYNFCPIPHQRTEKSTGRGGTSQSTFHLAEYDQTRRYAVGELSRDEIYERAE
jgi:D-mannonate dehydratase